MSKITIKQIKSIKDESGKYGLQKKIWFIDESGTSISGWVPIARFNQSDWVEGNSIELEIYKNGEYTNFKMPNQKSTIQSQSNNEVLDALRKVYEKLNLIESKIDGLSTPVNKPVDHSFLDDEGPF